MAFKNNFYRKFPHHLIDVKGKYLLGKNHQDITSEQLIKISDNDNWQHGEAFIPNKIGKYTTFNADGREIVRKDLPKEVASAPFNYIRKEWHGNEQVEIHETAYRHYPRYPRDMIPAPNAAVKCLNFKDEKIFAIELDSADSEDVNLHKLNLALEVFGKDVEPYILANDELIKLPKSFKLVNWQILRSGELSDKELLDIIQKTISARIKKTVRPVILERFVIVKQYDYSEIVIGLAGFKGYVVFQFPQKGISVLECDRQYNATYVFDYENWESLSKLSKTEILESKLAKERIIHDERWQVKINTLLK